ncbi:MAG: transcriptional regulator [Deltaproteobacteria bacterium]|nr:transcriptional regulator [Nannocystaceae bacterium]
MTEDDEHVVAFRRGANLEEVSAELRAALEQAMTAAAAARPGIDAPTVQLAEAIGLAVADTSDPVTAIAALHGGDLWLASACAADRRGAIPELDRILASLRPTLARMGADATLIDELLQQHRARLLAGDEQRPPRIRGYRGHGDLRSWLKVALVRDAVRALRRGVDSSPSGDELDRLMDPGGDPELAAMQDGYREGFRAAFGRALAELESRERNVLRYHLLEELSIDDIGAIYRVHRATAARWLVRIREELYESTRRELMHSLAITPAELDSVFRLIRSKLDASIAHGLAEPELGAP